MHMIILPIIGALAICVVFVLVLLLASPKKKKSDTIQDPKPNQDSSQIADIRTMHSETHYFYKKCPSLLTNNELAFYKALLPVAASNSLVIFSKVRIADLIKPAQNKNWQSAFNKINQKHIDFVLCDKITVTPILAIELDDMSHQRPDRQQRDIFVDNAFKSAGLPIIHTLSSAGLSAKIDAHINTPKRISV